MGLSFIPVHTKFGTPMKLFRHYAFSSHETPDSPLAEPQGTDRESAK